MHKTGIVNNTGSRTNFLSYVKLDKIFGDQTLYNLSDNKTINREVHKDFTELLNIIAQGNDEYSEASWNYIEEAVATNKYFSFQLSKNETDRIFCDCTYDPKNGIVYINIYSLDAKINKKYLEFFWDKFEKPEEISKDEIEVNFWTYNGKHGVCNERDLAAQSWGDIKENYSEKTREQLDSLAQNFLDRNGKLLIFAGVPGTGKTTVIRSLAKEWENDVKCEYIIDPETFFNGPPNYMMNLILHEDAGQYIDPWEYDMMEEAETDTRKKLIILEDCGELIKSTAKLDVGQGLARFLNVIDGMIGQGLDIAVLLTTNEKIEDFHPAVTREGRINTMIDFEKFSESETNIWLENNGVVPGTSLVDKIHKQNGLTLAECFDALNKSDNQSVKILKTNQNKQAFGFAATA